MTRKEQLSKFLQNWEGDGYSIQSVYIEKECADLMAEGILKILGISNNREISELRQSKKRKHIYKRKK